MVVLANRVFETTTTQGVGAYSLAGAVAGHRTFVGGVGDGASVHYTCTDGVDFEVGTGTVTAGSPDTLSRGAILDSSNGGAAVNWGTGTRSIFIDIPAEAIMLAANNLSDVANAATALANLGGLGPGGGVLTGDLEIQKASPKLILDRTGSNDPTLELQDGGSNRGGISVDLGNSRVEIDYRSSGGVIQGQLQIGNSTLAYYDGTTTRKVIAVAAGSKAWWYQATAPAGWTIDATVVDFVLSAESSGGGTTGGTWTISGVEVSAHVLTVAELPATVSGRSVSGSGSPVAPPYPLAYRTQATTTSSQVALGSGAAHSHAIVSNGTWRPARAKGIICTVD